jgi:hypothetical protein
LANSPVQLGRGWMWEGCSLPHPAPGCLTPALDCPTQPPGCLTPPPDCLNPPPDFPNRPSDCPKPPPDCPAPAKATPTGLTSPRLRTASPPRAQSGRQTLENAIRLVESHPDWRARVVYGDTDSLFVLLPGRSRTDAFEIGWAGWEG